jgi:hypothetical protein
MRCRLLIGVGGARMLARKYVALNIAEHAKSKYSSFFVLFSAVGMTGGPGLALVLGVSPEVTVFGKRIHEYCYVSWIMVFVWAVFGVLFYQFFREPRKVSYVSVVAGEEKKEYYKGDVRKLRYKERNGIGRDQGQERRLVIGELQTEGGILEDDKEDPLIETVVTDRKGRPLLAPSSYPKIIVNRFSNRTFFFLVAVLFLVKVLLLLLLLFLDFFFLFRLFKKDS